MSTYADDVTWYIADNWETYFASAVLSGIVGDAEHAQRNSYHNSLEDNPDQDGFSNYRPDDAAPPGNWPRNLASAIDMSMSDTDMATCSWRLWDVWNDTSDPRRAYVNAFNGWFNDGGPAKRYDYVSQDIDETTDDHKWHVHLSIRRKYVQDMQAAEAILSILRGESKQDYLDGSGGGSVTAGEEDMYAKKGMGLSGSPVSHNTMYLQRQMFTLVEGDPRLDEYPLDIDGKYGSNTCYWVSVLLTGGAGDEVSGDWFGRLDQMVSARLANGEVTGHLDNTIHGGEGGGSMPTTATIVIPEQTVVGQLT